jgi:hypothetical protein
MDSLGASKVNRLQALVRFSLSSLPQPYGRAFVQRIVLRHPVRTLQGLLRYWKLSASSPLERWLMQVDEAEFVKLAARDGERLLVTTGFCQKPLGTAPASARPALAPGGGEDGGGAERTTGCPAERFNHDCAFLPSFVIGKGGETQPPCWACRGCFIRVLSAAALRAGASFAVLTSAQDVADDILLPALEEEQFTRVLFAICPYSVEAMSLALLICGVEGAIFTYHSGSCTNYREWLRADGGDKPGRTVLSPDTMDRMLRLLDLISAHRHSSSLPQMTHYQQSQHVYRPRDAPQLF